MNTENNFELKTIDDIIQKYKFIVPSYQRGYRWKENEVKDLLNDIKDYFSGSDISLYCLQPIVVKKDEGKEKTYELIDGQQRLITIYLILRYLKDNIEEDFITYETKGDKIKNFINYLLSLKFNEDLEFNDIIKANKEYDTIDNFHIFAAYRGVFCWFKHNSKDNEFKDNIKNKVSILWYEIKEESTSSENIFSRINSGKVALTDAELVKALFLNDNNREIAFNWIEIEKMLNNDDFWFLFNEKNEENYLRMNWLLKMAFESTYNEQKSYKNSYPIFTSYYKKFYKDKEEKKEVWTNISKFFDFLKIVYYDTELYHLVGFCLLCERNISLKELYKEYNQKVNKDDFKEFLKEKVKENIQLKEIDNYMYGKDDTKIKEILLLFNIITYENNNVIRGRFPFRLYKKEKWSIEHIHARNADINNIKFMEDWLNDIEEYYLDKLDCDNINNKNCKFNELKSMIKKLRDKDIEQIPEEIAMEFMRFYNDVNNKLSDIGEKEENKLSNLALLSQEVNDELNNKMFLAKRSIIIDILERKDNNFIPQATVNVFLKYYSKKLGKPYLWSKEDRDAYIETLKSNIKEYLFKEKNNER